MHQSPVFARFNHNLSSRPILGIDSAQKRNHGSRKGPMYVCFIKKEAISYGFIKDRSTKMLKIEIETANSLPNLDFFLH